MTGRVFTTLEERNRTPHLGNGRYPLSLPGLHQRPDILLRQRPIVNFQLVDLPYHVPLAAGAFVPDNKAGGGIRIKVSMTM